MILLATRDYSKTACKDRIPLKCKITNGYMYITINVRALWRETMRQNPDLEIRIDSNLYILTSNFPNEKKEQNKTPRKFLLIVSIAKNRNIARVH